MTSISFEKGLHRAELPSIRDRLRVTATLAHRAIDAVVRLSAREGAPYVAPAISRPDFKTLERLRSELSRDDDTDEVTARDLLSDSAEHLLDQQRMYEEENRRYDDIGIDAVWNALRTWDQARTPATEALAAHVLSRFSGAAQPTLDKAFRVTRRESATKHVAFDEVLARLNEENRR